MENKRGVSAVEVIVSFTIFVAFVVFIFAYLNPIKKDISDALLVSLEAGVKKNAMSELREFPIVVNNAPKCISIGLNNLPFNMSEGNLSVKKLNDDIISHKISGNNLWIENMSESLYRIIYSDEIEKIDSSSLNGCVTPSYGTTVERVERIYSYKKLVRMNYSYFNDYTTLKQKLNYPITSDFAILISNNDNNFSISKNIPKNMNVKVRKFPIQILKNDIKTDASMTLITW